MDVARRQPVLPALVRLALAAGDFSTVTAAVRTAMAVAESTGVAGLEITADWCRGLVAQEPDTLRAAASHYRTVSRPLELGMVTEDLAEVLAMRGEFAAARAALTEAVNAYTGL